MKTQAIIFDLDGVIVDTAKFHYEAWKMLADELSMHFDEEINERLKGISRMGSFEIILEVNNASDKYTESEKETFCTRKNDLYVQLISKLTPSDVLPGVKEFIEKAKAHNIKCAVASVSRNAPAVLDSLKVADLFDYVADAAKVTKSKPDPEIFLVCAENLGVSPDSCIGVEDAGAGIDAIKAAGMYAVGINVTVLTSKPDLCLNSTAELDFEKIVF